jgi:hypothetical protein
MVIGVFECRKLEETGTFNMLTLFSDILKCRQKTYFSA